MSADLMSRKVCAYCISYFQPKGQENYCSKCEIQEFFSRGIAPVTQKGIGIRALANYTDIPTVAAGFARRVEDIPATGYPLFARPAPSSPRHGYIDSGVVNSREEAAAKLEAVLADDPKGELILCPVLNAEYNLVWTPYSMAIGTGNDGATAGKDAITIPLAGVTNLDSAVLKKARIAEDMCPFIEGVIHDNWCFKATQLREGPVPPKMGNFIPKVTEVQKVLIADVSLYQDLAWEQEIKACIRKEGVVVWNQNGSILDHFSIHAFSASIPIIFGPVKPEIGDVLHPTCDAPTFDVDEMLKGIVVGWELPLVLGYKNSPGIKPKEAVGVILTALHNATVLTGTHAYWLGCAAALMIRVGSTAMQGELRHFPGMGGSSSRENIYSRTLGKSLKWHRARINRTTNVFRYGKWTNAGFGGVKWARCGAAIVKLLNAIHELASTRTQEATGELVRQLNVAVNQAHNGGWWLNKFATSSMFSNSQKGDVTEIGKIVPALYEIASQRKSLTPAHVEARIESIRSWGTATLRPPVPKEVSMKHVVGAESLQIKVKTRLLGSRFRTLTAKLDKPLTATVSTQLKNKGRFVAQQDGYRLEISGTPVQLLWMEDSLGIAAAECDITEE